MKYCIDCSSPKSNKGKYCKSCGYKNRKRPSGLKYNVKIVNHAWFKKGHTPWCKGTHGIVSAWNKGVKGTHFSVNSEFKKGNIPWNNGIIYDAVRGEKHKNWKGNDVGYGALHSWIKRRIVKSNLCNSCKEEKPLDLSNNSGLYKRDLSDWEWLCRKCHHKKDNIAVKGWKTKKLCLNTF